MFHSTVHQYNVVILLELARFTQSRRLGWRESLNSPHNDCIFDCYLTIKITTKLVYYSNILIVFR